MLYNHTEKSFGNLIKSKQNRKLVYIYNLLTVDLIEFVYIYIYTHKYIHISMYNGDL